MLCVKADPTEQSGGREILALGLTDSEIRRLAGGTPLTVRLSEWLEGASTWVVVLPGDDGDPTLAGLLAESPLVSGVSVLTPFQVAALRACGNQAASECGGLPLLVMREEDLRRRVDAAKAAGPAAGKRPRFKV